MRKLKKKKIKKKMKKLKKPILLHLAEKISRKDCNFLLMNGDSDGDPSHCLHRCCLLKSFSNVSFLPSGGLGLSQCIGTNLREFFFSMISQYTNRNFFFVSDRKGVLFAIITDQKKFCAQQKSADFLLQKYKKTDGQRDHLIKEVPKLFIFRLKI
jgi:hypothetical protein